MRSLAVELAQEGSDASYEALEEIFTNPALTNQLFEGSDHRADLAGVHSIMQSIRRIAAHRND